MPVIRLLILSLAFISHYAHSESNSDPTPTVNLGAKVFIERCILCHGSQGLGHGILPAKLKNYPNTNLHQAKFDLDRQTVRDIIVFGGTKGNVSPLMPPMGSDLSWTETESVVNFVLLLRQQRNKALQLLANSHVEKKANRRLGQEIFSDRCYLCHGKEGKGDGRMAKIITSPPPANLTKTTLSITQLKAIITHGGKAVGRSDQMPPWGSHLNDIEINSLILFIESISH